MSSYTYKMQYIAIKGLKIKKKQSTNLDFLKFYINFNKLIKNSASIKFKKKQGPLMNIFRYGM